jgi:hypothetical protein
MAEQCRFLNQLNVQNEESAAQLMSFGYKTPPSLSDAMDATVESTWSMVRGLQRQNYSQHVGFICTKRIKHHIKSWMQ